MHPGDRAMRGAIVLTLALAVPSCEARDESGQATSEQPAVLSNLLEGTWQPVQAVVTRGDSTETQDSEPTLYIFSPTHYTMMGTIGGPRVLYSTLDPTDEEKLAAFNSFWGNGGTYDVVGNTLTIHPAFARNPNYMAGGYRSFQFRVVGDTLWLNSKSTDGHFRLGGEVVPDPRPFSETEIKLVRIR